MWHSTMPKTDEESQLAPQVITEPNLPKEIAFSGEFNYKWLLKTIEKSGDITNPLQGHDVIFERSTAGGKFERGFDLNKTPIAATEAEINAIASAAYDFEESFRPPDEKYFKKMETCVAAVRKCIEERSSIKCLDECRWG